MPPVPPLATPLQEIEWGLLDTLIQEWNVKLGMCM